MSSYLNGGYKETMDEITHNEETNAVIVKSTPLDTFRAGLAADKLAPISLVLCGLAIAAMWSTHYYIGGALLVTFFGTHDLVNWITRNIRRKAFQAVSFDDTTLTLHHEQIGDNQLGWLSISGIENTRDYILIHADGFNIYPIPKRCFSSRVTANHFARRMFDHWRSANSTGHKFALCGAGAKASAGYVWMAWIIGGISFLLGLVMPWLLIVALASTTTAMWLCLMDRSDRAWLSAAALAFTQRNFEQAWHKLHRALNRRNRDPEAFLLGMSIQIQLRDYPEAIRLATEALERDERSPRAFRGRAQAYELLGEHDKSQADRARAVALNPHWAGEADMQYIDNPQVRQLIVRVDKVLEITDGGADNSAGGPHYATPPNRQKRP